MLIKIGNFAFTEVWDGVLCKKLSQYPAISDWEKRNIIEFVEYEASHGRECEVECENASTLAVPRKNPGGISIRLLRSSAR